MESEQAQGEREEWGLWRSGGRLERRVLLGSGASGHGDGLRVARTSDPWVKLKIHILKEGIPPLYKTLWAKENI